MRALPNWLRLLWQVSFVLAFFGDGLQACAQVVHLGNRPTAAQQQNTPLNTLTVTSSPSAISFTLASGTAVAGSAPVSISTSWLLGVAATVRLYGFFSSTAALTSTGADGTVIPTSSVLGQCPTGAVATMTPFTQTSPFSGATSLLLFQQSATVSLLVNRTDQLLLKIDLSTLPQFPAGTYSGTLVLQAQAL